MNKSDIIYPKWDAPTNIKALTTTRASGHSTAPFDSLNLGDHVGDSQQHVQQNRADLRSYLNLPSEPFWLKQTHTTKVLNISKIDTYAKSADGAFSSQHGRVCVVMTADCLPLFLCNRQGSKVAVIHAGWRGLADGIVEEGVRQFAEPAGNLLAWSGPSISQQYFEIGEEVRQELEGSDDAYRQSDQKGKYYANLYKLVDQRLSKLGVEHSWRDDCTYADKNRFFSYRRDGSTGRMASLIWLEG